MYLLIISILLLLLVVAAWQDFQRYQIANQLVFSGAALGILLNSLLPAGLGISESLLGWGVGLLLLLPFYLLCVMAAGDVKLLAMVGAFLGPQAMVNVLLYVFLTGGVLAIAIGWHRGVLRECWYAIWQKLFPFARRRLRTDSASHGVTKDAKKVPYGIAISVGTAIFLISTIN